MFFPVFNLLFFSNRFPRPQPQFSAKIHKPKNSIEFFRSCFCLTVAQRIKFIILFFLRRRPRDDLCGNSQLTSCEAASNDSMYTENIRFVVVAAAVVGHARRLRACTLCCVPQLHGHQNFVIVFHFAFTQKSHKWIVVYLLNETNHYSVTLLQQRCCLLQTSQLYHNHTHTHNRARDTTKANMKHLLMVSVKFLRSFSVCFHVLTNEM